MYNHQVEYKSYNFTKSISYMFYLILYRIVSIWDLIHTKCISLKSFIDNIYQSLLLSLLYTSQPIKPISFPSHVAFSGTLAQFSYDVVYYILLCTTKGVRDITLYDPSNDIDINMLIKLFQQANTHGVWAFKQITKTGLNTTIINFSHRHPVNNSSINLKCSKLSQHVESSQKNSNDLFTHQNIDFRLTIVKKGMGRASLVYAARHLADTHKSNITPITPEEVTKYLDQDQNGLMLPSEPDVVIVFPDKESHTCNILNEFPVWQLRLTQIRFAEVAICNLSAPRFLKIIESAAKTPKRFGR